ncbi:hypothetical protein BH09DEP1_BH09DEP1_3760 [soil metagenome]
MNKLLTLSLLLSVSNITVTNECLHTHDTNNVGHQFYDALVETPKDAIVKGAIATKDLTKTVAAAVVYSSAAHELKDAAKELVVDAPVKAAIAIKNGALKAYDSTKEGAKVVYENAVVKPAHAIKNTAHDIAESDFVQGTKETAVEVGEQFAEAGQDAWDATRSGARSVYHVLVEKPVGAVKAAGHYLAHGDECVIEHNHAHAHKTAVVPTTRVLPTAHEKFVVVGDAPVVTQTDVICPTHAIKSQSHKHLTTVSVMSPAIAENVVPGMSPAINAVHDPKLNIEFLINAEPRANSTIALSENTLKQLSEAYDSVAFDLSHQL